MISILVISSCTKTKAFELIKMPKCSDITSKNDKEAIINKLPNYSCKAIDMYLGPQHRNIIQGVKLLRNIAQVDFYILSAGFGLIEEKEIVPVYECSFSDMSSQEIIERAQLLDIPKDFQKILLKKYDLIYLALGENYIVAIGDWENCIHDLTIAFSPSRNSNVITIKANNDMAAALSLCGYTIHGVIGLKGDLLRIISEKIMKENHPSEKLVKILKNHTTLQLFLEYELIQSKQKTLEHFFK